MYSKQIKDDLIKKICYKGHKFYGKYLNFAWEYASEDEIFCIRISSSITNAVNRNLFKRRIRSLYKDFEDCIKNINLVVRAKTTIISSEFSDLQNDFDGFIKKIKK